MPLRPIPKYLRALLPDMERYAGEEAVGAWVAYDSVGEEFVFVLYPGQCRLAQNATGHLRWYRDRAQIQTYRNRKGDYLVRIEQIGLEPTTIGVPSADALAEIKAALAPAPTDTAPEPVAQAESTSANQRATEGTTAPDASKKVADKKRTGFTFVAPTLFIVAATSTVTQLIAAATLGVTLEWNERWSTGGLVALISSIVMWVKCRSWASWRKWIWPPIGITVVGAFIGVNLMVASARADEDELERERQAEVARKCAGWEDQAAELDRKYQNLVAKAEKYVKKREAASPEEYSPFSQKFNPYTVQDYLAQRGGTDMEEQHKELSIKYQEVCS